MGIFIIYFISFLLNVVHSDVTRVDPLVLIGQGLVRGVQSADGKYSSFLGIPYASVNLSNPFGPNLPHLGFGGETFNAFDGFTRCPQRPSLPVPTSSLPRNTDALALRLARLGGGTTVSPDHTLDCLTLNIYIPTEASRNNLLPVLAWLHGGAFLSGSAGTEGFPYLTYHGIIVVEINYRVGPYGFFCLNSPLAAGNQGLKDQHEALNWINRNIIAFGGDPQNVTLGGLSAGGASAIYHLYSKREKLFHKIISQSGAPLVEGLFVKGDTDAALKLADILGHATNNTDEALAFLINTPHELVSQAFLELSEMLSPCTEREFDGVENFITDDLYSFSNPPKVRETPILIGHVQNEIFGPFETVYGVGYVNNLIRKKLHNNFNFDDAELTRFANIVKKFYIGDEIETASVRTQLEKFDSDFMFVNPILRTIDNLKSEGAGPIFLYVFSYSSDSDPTHAVHGYDKKFLFNTTLLDDLKDQLISDRITTLWENFIKYGNPTPEPTELLPVIWQPVKANKRPCLVIDTDMRMDSKMFHDRMAFWDLFFSSFTSKHVLVNDSLNIV